MASPLWKRLPRQLRSNLGKNLGIFSLLVVTIAFGYGFLGAIASLQEANERIPVDYALEDGRFTASFAISHEALAAAEEAAGVTIYENFSYDVPIEGGTEGAGTVRIYAARTVVDLACYFTGHAPETADEIALNRNYCENNGLEVGSTVTVAGRTMDVCGVMTVPDYMAMFQNNTDFMMNAVTFCVAEVSDAGFAALSGEQESYTYSFVFDDEGLTPAQRADREEELTEALSREGVVLSDLVDADANQGIVYPAKDQEGDAAIMTALVLIVVVVVAFLFAVLISGTIFDESAIIGTLLASGYRKREILLHYLAMPALVGVLGTAAGMALGCGGMVDVVIGIYAHNYSYPVVEPAFSWSAFAFTALVPLALLLVITALALVRKMRLTPLQFLRHELSRARARRGVRLPRRLSFETRFRLRAILSNASNYLVLALGLLFASALFLFGMGLLPSVESYAALSAANLPAAHQYLLKVPVELEGTPDERAQYATLVKLVQEGDPAAAALMAGGSGESAEAPAALVNTQENSEEAIAQAEKFALKTLEIERPIDQEMESISVYGVQDGSAYFTDVEGEGDAVTVGTGFAEKFGLAPGDSFVLEDKYEGTSHRFEVAALRGNTADTNVYLGLDRFNAIFGNDASYFNGYASDQPLDLEKTWLASDVNEEALNGFVKQLVAGFQDVLTFFKVFALIVYFLLMYLLTRTIVERNTRHISYLKVFGYTDREVSRLYVRSITLATAAFLVVTVPLAGMLTQAYCDIVFATYSGHIVMAFPGWVYGAALVAGMGCYAIVSLFHRRAIRRVPLSLALKIQE